MRRGVGVVHECTPSHHRHWKARPRAHVTRVLPELARTGRTYLLKWASRIPDSTYHHTAAITGADTFVPSEFAAPSAQAPVPVQLTHAPAFISPRCRARLCCRRWPSAQRATEDGSLDDELEVQPGFVSETRTCTRVGLGACGRVLPRSSPNPAPTFPQAVVHAPAAACWDRGTMKCVRSSRESIPSHRADEDIEVGRWMAQSHAGVGVRYSTQKVPRSIGGGLGAVRVPATVASSTGAQGRRSLWTANGLARMDEAQCVGRAYRSRRHIRHASA